MDRFPLFNDDQNNLLSNLIDIGMWKCFIIVDDWLCKGIALFKIDRWLEYFTFMNTLIDDDSYFYYVVVRLWNYVRLRNSEIFGF